MNHSAEGKLFTEIVLETFKLSGLLVQAGDVMSAEFGLTSARWKVLGALASNSQRPMTVPQIARSMGQTRQAVQRLANEMVAEGFVDWQDNPDHKRAKLLVLTLRGREVYDYLWQRQAPWANAMGSQVTCPELCTTLEVLQKLVATLERG